MERQHFYALDAGKQNYAPTLAAGYEVSVWRPSRRSVAPAGMHGGAFPVWWLFHHLRMFSNRDYGVTTIRRGGRVVHRTCVFPRYFRFPFMAEQDLQIGDTWTDPAHRGKGLAVAGLLASVQAFELSGRRFWYLTEANNHPSQRVAEKSGFHLAGSGVRTTRFGLRALGQFKLTTERPAKQLAA
jgi:RimJ/RimL family protein N-acetyltransferase